MHSLDDTIAAIATAPGPAGLAVVRVSGSAALAIADAVFRGARPLAEAPSHTLHHGWVVWPQPAAGAVGGAERFDAGRRVDEAVAAIFRKPRSYTREDVVELSCHGGRLPAQRVLAAVLAAGARFAGPGEFTLRAFLNGRIDLTQAEAVADVIQAETETARELALAQLAGDLSTRLDRITERITDCLAEIEARVDFAEDVGGVEVPPHAIEAIVAIGGELVEMLESGVYARAVRDGVRLALIGRPNVGKSSLFNALVGESRAIVSPTPGTTRDRVSEAIEIAGVRVTLSDTAGLRETAEPVEAIGIDRAQQALEESRLALWVVDGSAPLEPADRWIAAQLTGKRVLVAVNKHDLPAIADAGEIEQSLEGLPRRRVVPVSATTGEGLGALREALEELLDGDRRGGGLGAAVSNPRHHEALGRAREALERAAAAGREGAPGEIVALELRETLTAIGEVTGVTIGEDLLDRIFSRFCVGK